MERDRAARMALKAPRGAQANRDPPDRTEIWWY
jgi:hypothetical protein